MPRSEGTCCQNSYPSSGSYGSGTLAKGRDYSREVEDLIDHLETDMKPDGTSIIIHLLSTDSNHLVAQILIYVSAIHDVTTCVLGTLLTNI
jgi:hypothetical protein